MLKTTVIFLVLFTCGCKSQDPVSSEETRDSETVSRNSEPREEVPQDTEIEGVFLGSDRQNNPDSTAGNAQRTAVNAEIRVEEILKKGMNYHGQYFSGDTVSVVFKLGVSADESKNRGALEKGDRFRSELMQDINRLTIYHYEKL